MKESMRRFYRDQVRRDEPAEDIKGEGDKKNGES
jgi:hypothetical protein